MDSVFNNNKSSLMDYMNKPIQPIQTAYGMNLSQLQGKGQIPAMSAFNTPYTQKADLGYGFDAMNGNNPASAFQLDDYMKYGKGAVDIGSGLMGIYGQFQANKMAKESLGMAREDQAMKRSAFNQYNQFRDDTKSAFA